ncbi:MAG: hypothetical protein IJ173_12070 [Kiritimatiellae bacterium]|nr:hypothetical protein [Kiritimatiellia bacterium]
MVNKVRPVRRLSAPRYPTIHEIGQADLSRVPSRWANLKSVVASLGTAAMALKSLALEAQTADAPAAPVAESPTRETEAVRQTVDKGPLTDVCPLAAVAVAGEGRGGFGCVAVNPPVMLAEAEALEIIEKEFVKRGIRLKDCPELDGVTLPSAPEKKRPVMLDFGTEKGDVMVEFISRDDVRRWSERDDAMIFSSFNVCDTRAAATTAVNAIAARKGGEPVTVGVLYDPFAYVPKDWQPSDASADSESAWRARQAEGRRLAREQLTAQIDAFFDYLARTGKLPARRDAPDASSH